jgi:hypothetical protein
VLMLSLLLAVSATTLPSFSVEASAVTNVSRQTVLISSSGIIVFTESSFCRSIQGVDNVPLTGSLSRDQLKSLLVAVEESRFMQLPDDVSSPPFFVDEPARVIVVSIDGRRHRVTASGLDRATSPEALCFRDLWSSVSQYLPATDLFDCFSAEARR